MAYKDTNDGLAQPLKEKGDFMLTPDSSFKTVIVERNLLVQNSEITKKEKIGEGHFSKVNKVEYKGKVLARKKYKDVSKSENKRRFFQEACILGQIKHPNIIEFIGVVSDNKLDKFVTEYAEGGDLLNFLQDPRKKLTIKERIAFCKDVSSGMAYLESIKCIHRDLAARNCLVKGTDPYTVKISDFGLSRLDGQCSLSDDNEIPVKWAAPEVLNGDDITSKSDVWSFGILMWEIFSKGKTPYSEVNMGCDDFYNILLEGIREIPPAETPVECKDMMTKCWNISPDDRDDFKTIQSNLEDIYR